LPSALPAGAARRPLPPRLKPRRRLRRVAWIVAHNSAAPI